MRCLSSLLITVGLFVCLSFLRQAQGTAAAAGEIRLTLEGAIERAIAENRDIEIARQRLVELEAIKEEARAQGLPQITGTGQYTRTWRRPEMIINGQPFRIGAENAYQAGVNASQLIFDGGRVFKAIRAAKTERARGIENVRQAEQEVTFQVRQTFYEILYQDKVIDVLDCQIKQLRGHLSSMRQRFSEGIESDYALMRQSVAVSNVEPQLIDAKRQRGFLINGLKVILAIPPADDLLLEGKFDYMAKVVPPEEYLVEKALALRPDLAAESLRIKSLEANVGVEKAAFWPTLTATTDFTWQGFSNDWRVGSDERTDSLTSGVGLSWPIFDGLKTHSRVKQAKAKLFQQRLATSELEDRVVRDIKDAYLSLVRVRETLASQKESFMTANRATSIASERFKSGLMSQIELLDTIQAQAQAEELYLRAQFDCITAEVALELAVGGEL